MIAPEEWVPADGLTLEPNAIKAVMERSGNLALTAGPGAGKTEMLAQRADFLLRTGQCRYPTRILAISFKVDASTNLKERVKRRCGPSLSGRFDSHTFHAFAKRLVDRFRPVLVGLDALNVGYTIGTARIAHKQITVRELIPFALEILRSSELARNALRQTYSDVFLDEFQDCTADQYKLIQLAFQGTSIRMTAVGDTKQKIMGWAGALDGVFLTFAQDFGATALNLYQNFRSQPQLLRMQNAIIQVMDPMAMLPEDEIKGVEGLIEVQQFETDEDEAEAVVQRILHLCRTDGLSPAEIGVLVRNQPDQYAGRIMVKLSEHNIPFRNEQQMQDLSTEPATQLVVDYLLVIFGSRQPDAYLRLMEQLTDRSFDEIDESRQRIHWRNFIETERRKATEAIRLDTSFKPIWACAKSFIGTFGKDALVALSSDYESTTRLKQVLTVTKDRLLELFTSSGEIVQALTLFTVQPAVRIMTVHKSKGLEFHTVILVGMEEEAFWGKDKNEERSIFFVGISRAKQQLVLTQCAYRATPASNPSHWKEKRQAHSEFLGYASPFVSN